MKPIEGMKTEPGMNNYVINIDLDKKCPLCGKGGSVNGGLCLECFTKKITGGYKMIGEKTLQEAVNQCAGMVRDHSAQIRDVFNNDGSLSVTLKTTFTVEDGGVGVETEIGFITGRVKDKSYKKTVNEDQEDLGL
jgi:hypothetical protein